MPAEHSSRLLTVCSLLTFSLACAGSIWLYYPGVMSVDSGASFGQAMGEGPVTNLHPPAFARLWRALLYFGPGPAPMLVVQNMLFWGGLWLMSRFGWMPLGRSHLWGVLIGALPPLLSQFGTIWKDVMTLALLSCSLGMLVTAAQLRVKALRWGALVGIFLLALMRYNSISSVVPLAIAFTIVSNSMGKRSIGRHRSVLLGTALGLLIWGVAWWCNARWSENDDAPWQTVASYELVGLSARSGENLLPAYWQHLTLEEIRSIYSPQGNVRTFWSPAWPISAPNPDLMPHKRTEKEEHSLPFLSAFLSDRGMLHDLRMAWVDAVLAHPFDYLDHKRALAGALLAVDTSMVCYPYQDTVIYSVAPLVGAPFAAPGSTRYEVNRALTWVFYTVRNSPLFRPWYYCLLSALLIPLLLHKANRSGDVVLSIFAFAPVLALLNAILLIAVTPSCEFRYMLPTVFGSVVVLPLLGTSSGIRISTTQRCPDG